MAIMREREDHLLWAGCTIWNLNREEVAITLTDCDSIHFYPHRRDTEGLCLLILPGLDFEYKSHIY